MLTSLVKNYVPQFIETKNNIRIEIPKNIVLNNLTLVSLCAKILNALLENAIPVISQIVCLVRC